MREIAPSSILSTRNGRRNMNAIVSRSNWAADEEVHQYVLIIASESHKIVEGSEETPYHARFLSQRRPLIAEFSSRQ
jgi:hypothetical protein